MSSSHGAKQWPIQDFPEGVRQLQRWGRQPIIFANFPQKLHENLDREGARVPGATPWFRQCETPVVFYELWSQSPTIQISLKASYLFI